MIVRPCPMPTLSALRLDIKEHVATVTLLAQGKASRMGPAFWREMPDLFAWLDRADDARVVVIRGEGAHFTVGLDLMATAAEIGPVLDPLGGAKSRTDLLILIEAMQQAITQVARCRKPVIAAIGGYCLGGGVDLITACDMRFASKDAVFSVRETRLAMVADVGTLARLPAIVGQGIAREWAMTGDDYRAEEAFSAGLLNRVFETQEALFVHAARVAERVAKNPPLVVQGIKQVLNAESERAAEQSLRTVGLFNAAFLPSADLQEAMSAFVEKRDPKFRGA